MSARQRRTTLSMMASKMGCIRNGAQHFRDGRQLLNELGHPILQVRSGDFFVDTLLMEAVPRLGR